MADEDIRIRADLEGALARDLDRATRAVDDLGDEAGETAIQLRIMDSAAAGAARSADDLRREAKAAESEVDDLGKTTAKTRKSTDEQTSALQRFHGILRKIKGVGFDFGAVMKAYKIPAIITAVSLLATVVSSLGAAGYAAVSGLAPLGALVVTLPAGLSAAAQGMVAVKLAMGGMSDAIEVLSDPDADPEQVAEKMRGLGKESRKLARYLAGLNTGPLADLRKSTGAALAPGLLAGLKWLEPLFPMLSRRITETAGTFGKLAEDAGKAMSNPFFSRQISRIMRTNNAVIDNGGRALGYLGQTLIHLVDAFRPVLRQMSEGFLRVTKFWEASARAGLETGKLSAFFRRAWRLAKDVGAVLGDLVVGLFNIGVESKVMGDYLGGSLERGAAAFREWTDSVEGRASIRQWFEDAIPVVGEVVGLLGDIAKMFGGMATNESLVPVIQQIRSELLPALGEMAENVGTSFGPALVSAATAAAELVNALSFSPMGAMLQIMADGVIALTEALEDAPGPVRTAVGSVLALSLGLRLARGGAKVLTGAFGPLVGAAVSVHSGLSDTAETTGLLGKTAAGTKGKWRIFRQSMGDSAVASSAFSGKIGTLGGKVGDFGRKIMGLRFVGPALRGIGLAARVMWLGIMGPVGLAIAAILAVVGVGVLLYKKWAPFRNLVDTVWAAVKTGAVAAFNAVMGAMKPVFAYFKFVFGVWKWIAKAAFAVIGTAATVTWILIKAGAKAMWGWIKGIFSQIKPFILPIWSVISAAAKVAWSAIKTAFGGAWDWIKEKWGQARAFFSGIWNAMSSGAGSAMEGVKDTINNVIGTINGMIGAFNKLPGPDIPRIPMLFAGGQVNPGMRAMVGEIGPEILVKSGGGAEIVGKSGPEVRNFTGSGFVLPNSVLEAAKRTDAALPTGLLSALETRTARPSVPRAESRDEGPALPPLHMHFHGDEAPSVPDAQVAARAAYAALLREREERGIG